MNLHTTRPHDCQHPTFRARVVGDDRPIHVRVCEVCGKIEVGPESVGGEKLHDGSGVEGSAGPSPAPVCEAA